MFDHVTIRVSDLETSRRFFALALGTLGFDEPYVSDLGSGPAQSLRLEASRAGTYRLRFGYRSADAFSALPAFANPLLSQGVTLSQHTFDRTRRMFDVDLEMLTDSPTGAAVTASLASAVPRAAAEKETPRCFRRE